jgi:hypothetical protein
MSVKMTYREVNVCNEIDYMCVGYLLINLAYKFCLLLLV